MPGRDSRYEARGTTSSRRDPRDSPRAAPTRRVSRDRRRRGDARPRDPEPAVVDRVHGRARARGIRHACARGTSIGAPQLRAGVCEADRAPGAGAGTDHRSGDRATHRRVVCAARARVRLPTWTQSQAGETASNLAIIAESDELRTGLGRIGSALDRETNHRRSEDPACLDLATHRGRATPRCNVRHSSTCPFAESGRIKTRACRGARRTEQIELGRKRVPSIARPTTTVLDRGISLLSDLAHRLATHRSNLQHSSACPSAHVGRYPRDPTS